MKALRKLRDGVGRIEVLLFCVAAILGAYLAVATALRGAKWPDEATWLPWSFWFIAMLVAAVFVPLYAFYKALDAYFQAADKKRAEMDERERRLKADLSLMCQRTVAAVADKCNRVEVNSLCAQVWLCKSDDTFDRRALFYLPDDTRKESGIDWRKGVGVAGTVWETEEPISADLVPFRKQVQDLPEKQFNALPPTERFGMTAADIRKTRRYTGVCAIPLFSQGDSTLVGVFIVDYMGDDDFDCVERVVAKRPISEHVAGCEKILTAAMDILPR